MGHRFTGLKRSDAMSGLSIAIKGQGQLFQIWPTHAAKQFPRATIYDRSATVTGLRQNEANLGAQGLLDAAGQASAQRIAQNLASPTAVDATLDFAGPLQNGTVTVTCKNGTEKMFQVRLLGLGDGQITQGFFHVDAAITLCTSAGPLA
jgi:hypothetical protein